MKIDVKKILCKSIMALMVIPFFLVNTVPVNADYDYDTYYVDPASVLSYVYWNQMGYIYTNNLTNSNNIAVPSVRTDTGNTNDRLICNASGTSYSCYYLGSSGNEGTFQYETTRAHTITEDNISVHGAELPWLSGSYIHDTAYSSGYRGVRIEKGGVTYMSFYSTTNPANSSEYTSHNGINNKFCQIWTQDGSSNIQIERIMFQAVGGVYYDTFKFTNPNQGSGSIYLNINFPKFNDNTEIIPVYIGDASDIDDSFKQRIGISTVTENYLDSINFKIDGVITNQYTSNNKLESISNKVGITNTKLDTTNNNLNTLNSNLNTANNISTNINNNLVSGNVTSQTANNNLSNSNTKLNNRVDQLNNIETEYNSDLNDALNDIDLSTDLVQHTGFTNAALWVSAQFNRLVVGTPLELLVTFSLITGLALVLIGKVRG